MKKKVVVIFVLVFLLSVGFSSVFASTDYNRKQITVGESFTFNTDKVLVTVSIEEMNSNKAGCHALFVVVTTGSVMSPASVGCNELYKEVKLPNYLDVAAVSFMCESSESIIVFWQ